jgi:hypothetical protein
MLPIWTEGDRNNSIRVSSQRRSSPHTCDTGMFHQFIRISQQLLTDFDVSSTTGSTSRTASTPAPTEGKERKPIETIPLHQKKKKKEELTTWH